MDKIPFELYITSKFFRSNDYGYTAYMIKYAALENIIVSKYSNTNINRSELLALRDSLRFNYKKNSKLVIYLNSYYLYECLTKYLYKWIENGFRNSDGIIKNAELWNEIAELLNKYDYSVVKLSSDDENINKIKNEIDIKINQNNLEAIEDGISDSKVKELINLLFPPTPKPKLKSINKNPVKAKIDKNEGKKFELTDEFIEWKGRKLFRIKALRKVGNVKKGTVGGFVEDESNLSQSGLCWIHDNAKVYDAAAVNGNAIISEVSEVFGSAYIDDNVKISNNAIVYGKAKLIGNCFIKDYAQVYGTAVVKDDAIIKDVAEVCGNSIIAGNYIAKNEQYLFNGSYTNV